MNEAISVGTAQGTDISADQDHVPAAAPELGQERKLLGSSITVYPPIRNCGYQPVTLLCGSPTPNQNATYTRDSMVDTGMALLIAFYPEGSLLVLRDPYDEPLLGVCGWRTPMPDKGAFRCGSLCEGSHRRFLNADEVKRELRRRDVILRRIEAEQATSLGARVHMHSRNGREIEGAAVAVLAKRRLKPNPSKGKGKRSKPAGRKEQ